MHFFMCNGFTLNVCFMALLVVQHLILDDENYLDNKNYLVHQFPPYSMVVIMGDDDHRNTRGHPLPNVAFDILLSLHLMQCDDAMRVMGTCHVLTGW